MEIRKGNTLVSNVRKADLLQRKLAKECPTISLGIVLDQVVVDALLLSAKLNGFGATIVHSSKERTKKGAPITPFL